MCYDPSFVFKWLLRFRGGELVVVCPSLHCMKDLVAISTWCITPSQWMWPSILVFVCFNVLYYTSIWEPSWPSSWPFSLLRSFSLEIYGGAFSPWVVIHPFLYLFLCITLLMFYLIATTLHVVFGGDGAKFACLNVLDGGMTTTYDGMVVVHLRTFWHWYGLEIHLSVINFDLQSMLKSKMGFLPRHLPLYIVIFWMDLFP